MSTTAPTKSNKVLYIIVAIVVIFSVGFLFFGMKSSNKSSRGDKNTKNTPSTSGDYDKLGKQIQMNKEDNTKSEGNYLLYSHYYDLLYQDKDYKGEAKYIIRLLKKHGANLGSALELGCGTGKHAKLLVDYGFDTVTGVDLSEGMIEEAKVHHSTYVRNKQLKFYQSDVRDVNIEGKDSFDVVLSLFHVVSYQIKTDDVLKEFAMAAKYVKKDGLFLFDVWYGPAVMSVKPETRVKHMESEKVKVMRIAKSDLFPEENKVHVNYEVFITDKETGKMTYTKETHPMRFYFTPELKYYLEQSGFQLLHSEQWMTGSIPSTDTWGVTFVAKRVN